MTIQNVEQAQFIIDMRLKIQANKDAGRPEYEGIDREEIKKVIAILRGNRALDDAKRKAGKGKEAPLADDDLAALFS